MDIRVVVGAGGQEHRHVKPCITPASPINLPPPPTGMHLLQHLPLSPTCIHLPGRDLVCIHGGVVVGAVKGQLVVEHRTAPMTSQVEVRVLGDVDCGEAGEAGVRDGCVWGGAAGVEGSATEGGGYGIQAALREERERGGR